MHPTTLPRRWVALLRAINVGGHTVTMESLRAIFTALGLARVETFIASGNVIFEAPGEDEHELARRIERQLAQSLGYEVATFLRSPAELAAITRAQPIAGTDLTTTEHMLYIAFLPAVPDAAAQHRLLRCSTEVDEFAIQGREVYWLCRKTISQSAFSGAQLERVLGVPATVRNITTVRKLATKYAKGE